MKTILVMLVMIIGMSSFAKDFINLDKIPSELGKKRAIFFNQKVEEIAKLGKAEQLKEVNSLFNRFIKYGSDLSIYKKANFIASVEETVLSMRGDCDDYVMAKFQALKHLGFKNGDMSLLYSTESGVRHIKLVVKADSKKFVLDSYNMQFRELHKKEEVQKDNTFADSKMFDQLLSFKNSKNNTVTLVDLDKVVNPRG